MSVFNGIGMLGSALHNIAKNNGTILILMLAEWEIWSIIKRPSKWSLRYDDTENQYFFYSIIYVVVTAISFMSRYKSELPLMFIYIHILSITVITQLLRYMLQR